jgi:PEP-CTERM motif-containing protein
MNRFVLVVLLALALPSAALANTVTITNNNGTLVASTSGLSLVSDLTGISRGYGNPHGSDIGTLSISLGPLATGSLLTGGTFGTGGGFSISVNPGVISKFPQGGVLFSGAFALCTWCTRRNNGGLGHGVPTWTLISPGTYSLTGYVSGFWEDGYSGYGFVDETFTGSFNSNGVFTATSISGFSAVTPEPSTIGLFVTGLVGIAGMVRRKLKV